MPGMTGGELAQRIRKDPGFAKLRLLLRTSTDVELEMGQEIEFAFCLKKPLRKSHLYDGLLTVLSDSGAETSPSIDPQIPVVSRSARVLLAEDNEVNQRVAEEMLRNLGCQVHVVDNGKAALQECFQESYDAIFMDCQMPEMDGYEAARCIREMERDSTSHSPNGHSRLTHTPIIALTANALKPDREACLAAGMDDYLSKPFRQRELAEMLDRWTSKASKPPSTPVKRDQRSPEGQDKGPIEYRALENIRSTQPEGSGDILKQILSLYLDDSPKLLSQLKNAVEQGDTESVRRTAHSLKSSSANVGANHLSSLLAKLELRGREESLVGTAPVLTQILGEYGAVRDTLTRELNDGGK